MIEVESERGVGVGRIERVWVADNLGLTPCSFHFEFNEAMRCIELGGRRP